MEQPSAQLRLNGAMIIMQRAEKNETTPRLSAGEGVKVGMGGSGSFTDACRSWITYLEFPTYKAVRHPIPLTGILIINEQHPVAFITDRINL